MNSSERLARTAQGGAVDRVPVQPINMMYAARYIGVPFRTYVRDYRELACAQLKVLEDFDIDIVTLCSDPCREVEKPAVKIERFSGGQVAVQIGFFGQITDPVLGLEDREGQARRPRRIGPKGTACG